MVYTPGPFASEHGYLQWGGALPGSEAWACGIRMAPVSGADVDATNWDMATLLASYVTSIEAYHASDVGLSNHAKLQFVKFNRIGRDGHYVDGTTFETTFPDVSGEVGGTAPPNQIALVVSLTTAVARGPAHRGRFYLPIPGFDVGGDGRWLQAYTDSAAAATTVFLDALNAAPPGTGSNTPIVAVMSRKAGAPFTRPVTGVAIGRVPDTQRRRRRSLAESYSFSPI